MGTRVKNRHSTVLEMLFKKVERRTPVYGVRTAAAVVSKTGKVIGIGFNLSKSDPFQQKFADHPEAIYIHAELSAIKAAIKSTCGYKELPSSTIYICRARFTSDKRDHSEWGLAHPCPACYKALVCFGIRKIVYSTNGTGNFQILER